MSRGTCKGAVVTIRGLHDDTRDALYALPGSAVVEGNDRYCLNEIIDLLQQLKQRGSLKWDGIDLEGDADSSRDVTRAAMPKSHSLIASARGAAPPWAPSAGSTHSTFSGLRSRYTTPERCRWHSTSSRLRATSRASRSE